MTKQHFELIARLIAESGDNFKSNSAHAKFAGQTAEVLAQTNPRFDRKRFILASMPRWMVGTKHSNVWEREATRGVEFPSLPRTSGPFN